MADLGAAAEARPQRRGDPQRTEAVDLDLASDAVEVEVVERVLHQDAGVVDQDVDLPVADGVDQACDAGLVR